VQNSPFRPETKRMLQDSLDCMLDDLKLKHNVHHLKGTADRVIKAWEELFSGTHQNAADVLNADFEESSYDQMVCVKDIDFVSVCAHHLLPFFGKVHFGYLPNKKVVGLSKIPRLVEILSHRPQIQEQLTEQIATTFQETLQPLGCAVLVEANHTCVSIRGVRKSGSSMITNALTGIFLEKPSVKEEFLFLVGKK
jgi:GTP cyclohydrolase I